MTLRETPARQCTNTATPFKRASSGRKRGDGLELVEKKEEREIDGTREDQVNHSGSNDLIQFLVLVFRFNLMGDGIRDMFKQRSQINLTGDGVSELTSGYVMRQ